MNTFFFTLIVSAIAIAFMIVALMITYWRKGYHLESDVGSNRHMKEKGIPCTSKVMREEEREFYGDKVDDMLGCDHVCSDCVTHCQEETTK